MQSSAAHFPRTLSLSRWGSFWGAVLGQLAQILSQQCSASSLSHAVDRGLPVLHTREFLWSSPWAVSSNYQLTVLGQYLVTCRQPQLACALHEGDFLNSLEEDHLPIYSVVTFWQGEYTHNELFGKPCFGEFLWSGPWEVSSNSQPAVLTHPLVTCSWPRLACAPRSTWECFPRICSHLTQDCLLDPFVLPYEGD